MDGALREIAKMKWPSREFQGAFNKTPSVDGNKRSKKLGYLNLFFTFLMNERFWLLAIALRVKNSMYWVD